MSVWAILVAAGRGERLGLDRPKAFANLGDEPLLAEPLRRLEACPWVDAIVLVAPPGWEEPAILLAEEEGCGKVRACVAGGEDAERLRPRRSRRGAGRCARVLVHDAARPLVTDEVVERVLAPLSEGWDGAVPGPAGRRHAQARRPDGGVEETVARDGLWAVQTPQAFAADAFRRALAATTCHRRPIAPGIVEAAGGRVKVVEGDPRLLKVTTAADLDRIASWL